MPFVRTILVAIFSVPLRWVAYFFIDLILKKLAQKLKEWLDKRNIAKAEKENKPEEEKK